MIHADTPMPGEDPGALIEDTPTEVDPVITPDIEDDPQQHPKPAVPREDDLAIEETERQPT